MNRKRLLATTMALCLFTLSFAAAQEISGNFPGGSVLVGYDSATCNSARAGAIRYSSATNTPSYCNGSPSGPVRSIASSARPTISRSHRPWVPSRVAGRHR